MFALNFETAFNIARPMFLHFKERGYGRLVFMGGRPALEAAAGKSMIAYGLSKSLLFKLAEFLNADAKGTNVVASVVVPSTLDTPANRAAMPDVNPANWVSADQLNDLLEFIFSDTADPLRQPVYKIYSNS
jgi:NAD(P)-dependent dehydrogenase (short-subunit alcohol dehydrogenase family)